MSRLYWKLFIWFWFALALLSVSIGWGVKIYIEQARPLAEQLPQAQVAAISLAFERGDTVQARDLLRQLNTEIRFPIFVVNSAGDDILGRPLPRFVARLAHHEAIRSRRLFATDVRLPNGEIYRVIAPRQAPPNPNLRPPWWLALSITLVISTLVCFWLARYLTAPISRLSRATQHLARGELSVRVGELRRKDEIADLAHDFDQMADKIQQLIDGRQQLLRDISHELRSPLARLQVALALARRKIDGPNESLDRIERDLLRVEELIGEVLTLSRLETTGDTGFDDAVNIGELVKQIAGDTALEAEAKGCPVDVTENGANPAIRGNRELLRRAIENALRNAIKYTEKDTTIDVGIRSAQGLIHIDICDRGPGVADGELERIFDPFVRLDSARGRDTGGYGLGLAIARKAMELHHGSISARHRRGGGLCITLSLPDQLGS